MFKKISFSFFELLIVVLILGCLAAILPKAHAQSAIIRGEESAGSYSNLKSTSGVLQTIINSGSVTSTPSGSGTQTVTFASTAADPCASPNTAKTSVIIAITSAATTQLVALASTQVVYVCNFTLTISQVITTANTAKFVYGTGANCGTGTTDLTGLFGGGGVTAAAPIVVMGGGNTLFKTAASNALCITTAIGASGSFQGVLTYVQI